MDLSKKYCAISAERIAAETELPAFENMPALSPIAKDPPKQKLQKAMRK